MDFFFPHLALAIIAFTPICTYNCDAGTYTAGTLAFLSKRGHLLRNIPCAVLGRRCGSAAYLSDAGITSSSWLHPYKKIIILSTQHTQFPNRW
jgi:hypothetical protein